MRTFPLISKPVRPLSAPVQKIRLIHVKSNSFDYDYHSKCLENCLNLFVDLLLGRISGHFRESDPMNRMNLHLVAAYCKSNSHRTLWENNESLW